jgi:hypothetical protein
MLSRLLLGSARAHSNRHGNQGTSTLGRNRRSSGYPNNMSHPLRRHVPRRSGRHREARRMKRQSSRASQTRQASGSFVTPSSAS